MLDIVGPEWICDFLSLAGGEHLQRNSFHLFVVFPPQRNEKIRVRLFYEAVGAHHLGAALDNQREENKGRESTVWVCVERFLMSLITVFSVWTFYRLAPS